MPNVADKNGFFVLTLINCGAKIQKKAESIARRTQSLGKKRGNLHAV